MLKLLQRNLLFQQNTIRTLRSINSNQLKNKFSSDTEEATNTDLSDQETPLENEGEGVQAETVKIVEPPKNVALEQDVRVQILQQQQQILREKFPVKIFDSLANIPGIQNNKDIRNMGQNDEQRYIRSRISNIFKKQQEMSVQHLSYQIQQLIQDSFSKQQYSIIGDKDFKTVIYNRNFKQIVPMFYNKQFFQENANFINNSEFTSIVQRCLENPDYYHLLELLKYHRSFLGKNISGYGSQQHLNKGLKLHFNEQQILLEFLSKVQQSAQSTELKQFDVLSIYYHFSVLYSTNIMVTLSTDDFVKELSNVIFGDAWTKSQKSQFRHNLHDLLYIQYQLSINNHFKYFLCDLFFSQETYEKSLTSFSLLTLILERLQMKQNNISDILHILKNTIEADKFDFYFRTHLPNVLQSYSNQDRYNLYKQGLHLYDQQIENGVSEFKILEENYTFLDKQFFNSEKQQIFYNYTTVHLSEIFTYNTKSSDILKKDNEDQIFKKSQNSSTTKFSPYIKNDKVEILKSIQQDLKFHGQLQSLYSIEDLEANRDNDEYLNDLISQAYKMIQDYNSYEHFNVKRFMERKGLPYHQGVKYMFSSFNSQRNNFKINQPLNILNETNSFYFKAKFLYSTSNNSKNSKIEDLENDLKITQSEQIIDNEGKVEENISLNQGGNNSKGFKEFIQKSQDIDSKKNHTFVSQEEINKLKSLQDSDTLQGKKRSKRSENPFQQQKINREKISKDKNTLQVKKADQVSITPVDYTYFSNLVTKQQDVQDLINLQKRLLELKGSDNERAAVLNGLLNINNLKIEGESEQIQFKGVKIFNKLFHQPTLFQMQNEIANPVNLDQGKLKYTYQHLDESEEVDFISKQYLKETLFPYQLSEKSVNALLEFQQQNFNRKQFKRILTHILQYSQELNDSSINKLISITIERRLPDTLWEFGSCLINNNIQISQEGFQALIGGICSFKDMENKILDLVRLSNVVYKWDVEIDLIEPYITQILKYSEESERVMTIFQNLKKIIYLNKVAYDDKLSSDENIKLQENQKNINKTAALALYRNAIGFMNEKRKYSVGQLIFNDMVAQKYELEEIDYINGIKVNQENPELVQELYDQAKKEPKLQLTEKFLESLLNIISANLTNYGGEFFEQVQKDLIMSNKIDLNIKVTNMCVGIYSRTKDYNGFGNLLNFFVKNLVRTNASTKSLCYRIVNESTEELSKGFLKGMLTDLFSQEQIDKTKEKEREEAKKNPEKYQKQREEYLQYQQERKRKMQEQNSKGTKEAQENRKIQQQKEQIERERKRQQQQKAKELEQQKLKKQQNEIRLKSEDVQNISFLQSRYESENQSLNKLATGPKQKRKIIKNAGFEKYESTQVFIEEGDQEGAQI